MSRYIDADKIVITAERGISADGLIFIPMIDVHRSIDATPTADVAEVRHGEWQIVDSDIGYYELECSLCKNKLLFNTDDGFTYCPNCGACMRGKNNV